EAPFGNRQGGDLALDPLADDVQLPFERELVERRVAGSRRRGRFRTPRRASGRGRCRRRQTRRVGEPARGDEEVLEIRFDGARPLAEQRVVGRHPAPPEQGLDLLVDDAGDDLLDLTALIPVARQEDQTDAVAARRRQLERQVRRGAEELVRDLNQDAGAVAGVRLAAARAAVLEIQQDLDALGDDVVRLAALEMDDEPDAAGVLLVLGIVKSLSLWDLAVLHIRASFPVPRRRHHGPARERMVIIYARNAGQNGNTKVSFMQCTEHMENGRAWHFDY